VGADGNAVQVMLVGILDLDLHDIADRQMPGIA
jgi:hypothetical protein